MKYVMMLLLLCAPSVHAADLMFLGGSAVINGPTIAVEATLTQPYRSSYSIQEAVTYIGASTWEDGFTREPSKFVVAGRVVKTWNNKMFFGVGASFATRIDEYNGSRLNFNEVAGITLFNRLVIELEHNSNAGMKKPNRGRNLVLIGYKF